MALSSDSGLVSPAAGMAGKVAPFGETAPVPATGKRRSRPAAAADRAATGPGRPAGWAPSAGSREPVKLSDRVTLCIGIGAQRAGTSWLATYFDGHPAIFMSPIKELHYFDALWLPGMMGKRNAQHLHELKRLVEAATLDDVASRGPAWQEIGRHYDRLEMVGGGHARYLDYFANRVGACRVAAEITPAYAMLGAAHFRAIRSLHPRMKAIYILRNPVDRAWSALRRRGEHATGDRFDAAIAAEGLMLRSDYPRTLRALAEGFPQGDVLVEFYETLFTEAAIRRICAFLDVPYHPAPLDRVVNEAEGRPIEPGQRLRLGRLLRPVYEYCHEQFGERLPGSWRADLNFIAQGD